MNAREDGRSVSPNVGAAVIALAVAGLLFLILSGPWTRKEPEPEPELPPAPESELRKVGLPDNVDLEMLPGIFAVWADQAEWVGDKTVFAYRHPISREFSYYFEATRTADGYRFREVSRRVTPFDGSEGDGVPEDIPILFPAVAKRPVAPPVQPSAPSMKPDVPVQKVEIELKPTPVEIPSPGTESPSIDRPLR